MAWYSVLLSDDEVNLLRDTVHAELLDHASCCVDERDGSGTFPRKPLSAKGRKLLVMRFFGHCLSGFHITFLRGGDTRDQEDWSRES